MKNILLRWRFTVALVLMAGLGVSFAAAALQEIKPSKQWKGDLPNEADRDLMKAAPTAITTADELAKLWKAWRIQEPLPEVDFTKEFVLVNTTVGSVLNVRAMLGKDGDLRNMGIATKDLRPGFRYALSTLNRGSVKTVDGKPLPNADKTAGPK